MDKKDKTKTMVQEANPSSLCSVIGLGTYVEVKQGLFCQKLNNSIKYTCRYIASYSSYVILMDVGNCGFQKS